MVEACRDRPNQTRRVVDPRQRVSPPFVVSQATFEVFDSVEEFDDEGGAFQARAEVARQADELLTRMVTFASEDAAWADDGKAGSTGVRAESEYALAWRLRGS